MDPYPSRPGQVRMTPFYLNTFEYLCSMSGTLKGKFRPSNPEKYRGDPTNIIHRSSWERIFMNWCDKNSKIKSWQSEEKALWYYDPVTKKKRRYFPDFIINYENSRGIMVTEMIEIKPKRQVDGPPTNPKRRTKGWVNAVNTYVTNRAKWEAAAKICEDRGWNFRIVTEVELGLSK